MNSAIVPRLLTALLLALARGVAQADDGPSRELLLVGRTPTNAEFQGVDTEGRLLFRTDDGGTIAVARDELVRWSNPASARAADELHLVDGSQLGLAAGWGGDNAIKVDDGAGTATTNLLGKLSLDRAHMRAVFWRLPPDPARRRELANQLEAIARDDEDVVMLDNGDSLSGAVVSIAAGDPDGERPSDVTSGAAQDGPHFVVSLRQRDSTTNLPGERLHAVAFAAKSRGDQRAPTERGGSRLIVGLRDGTRVAADSISADGEQLAIASASFAESPRIDPRDVSYLQSRGGRVAYLSDFEPAAYRHEPYLELPWPYRRDRNALDGVLVVGDRTYAKGLGLHSAARLTYELDVRHARFAAAVAVDDAARGRGSVVFRVFLRRGEELEEAFASPVMRGGDGPRPIVVDLAGATELSLVVDYADRGDERDYADWLDARLESP